MKKNKIAVIVQCRLSSSRLSHKALKDLNGKTVLDWVLISMKKVKANKYYVATDSDSFSALEPICKRNGFELFVGDLNNVLNRFCELIKKIKVDIVVRATADNPFLFYEAAQLSLEDFIKKNSITHTCDYLTYTGLPHGCGVEIIDANSLLKAEKLTDSSFDKEHVGPALYNHKEHFYCEFIKAPKKFYYPELRTTIDTYTDYLRAILAFNYLTEHKENTKKIHLFFKDYNFTTEQILQAFNSDYVQKPILFIPSVKKGHGTGHLHRCLESCINSKEFIYIPDDYSLEETPTILQEYKEKGLKDFQIINQFEDDSFFNIAVTDLFKTSKKEIDFLNKFRTVIGLDEGNDSSSDVLDNFDYLLDIIPNVDETRKVNNTDCSFIRTPKNKKIEVQINALKNCNSKSFSKILICIGGEDPENLTSEANQIFKELYPNADITVVGKGFNSPIKDLKETLFEYDLVVTHYGLTAYEAISAGCKVLLLSTSILHEKLAKQNDFAFIPYKNLTLETVKLILAKSDLFNYKYYNNLQDSKDLGLFIKKLSTAQKIDCPVCQKNKELNKIIFRNSTRTYRRCSNCSMMYLSWSLEEEKNYQKSYFFEDYKKQYGKTYQEDFESIKKQSEKRVNVINTLIKKNSLQKNVLDIGCAYGPFLKAASEKSFIPFGTDVSEDAINYVKNQLNFPSSVAAFPEIDTEKEFGLPKFDVVTMWYVIEHFKNLSTVLQKVNHIVKQNGIFAFSTPSGLGVSYKSNKDDFFAKSPSDHFTIWEFSKANKILKTFGFKIEKIVSTGHHPERFSYIKENNIKPNSLKWNLISKYSRIKKLGDTVEIYCRKIKEI